ncbi:hypothetical protein Plhal304r1_c031g0101471 [Plasmopara halstedii]
MVWSLSTRLLMVFASWGVLYTKRLRPTVHRRRRPEACYTTLGYQRNGGSKLSTRHFYVINRKTNSTLPDKTPYEASFKIKPRVEYLREFGSQCYAHVDDSTQTNLKAKSYQCLFLGYAEGI